MAILSFLGRVNIAVRLVQEQYPQAKLYEVDATPSDSSVTDPEKFDLLRVVFQNENNSTVFIRSTGWGTFGEPTLIPEPWLEDVVINWPVEMTLEEAIGLKNAAGFGGPSANMTLRNPLGPTLSNPCYIFGYPGKAYVFVDTITKKVHSGF